MGRCVRRDLTTATSQVPTQPVCAAAPVPVALTEEATDRTFRVPARTPTISPVAFIAHPDLDPDVLQRVRQCFHALHQRSPHLLPANVGRYLAFESEDYDDVRALIDRS